MTDSQIVRVLLPVFELVGLVLALCVLLCLDPQYVPVAGDHGYEPNHHLAQAALFVSKPIIQLIFATNQHRYFVTFLTQT